MPRRGESIPVLRIRCLSCGTSSAGTLERQPDVWQEVLDGTEEPRDGMKFSCHAQIPCRHVNIDLGARNESVAENIADDLQSCTLTDEVGRAGVSQAMRRKRLANVCAASERAHALIESAA